MIKDEYNKSHIFRELTLVKVNNMIYWKLLFEFYRLRPLLKLRPR